MTPKLAIVAFPRFTAADRAAIRAVRERHDPQFALLDPHFTLVFPVEAPLHDIVGEARSVADASAPFPVTLNSILAVRDALGAGGHVFLVPERGAREVSALNARLYSGALKGHRVEIPYVPHITVAASADFLGCQVLAAELARNRWNVNGSIESLSVLKVTGAGVMTMAELPLGDRGIGAE